MLSFPSRRLARSLLAASLLAATAALEDSRPEDTRISLLGSLAESATHYGSRLTEVQLDGVRAMLDSAKGDLGLAAARAFGAHSQPTAKVVDLITK